MLLLGAYMPRDSCGQLLLKGHSSDLSHLTLPYTGLRNTLAWEAHQDYSFIQVA